jgi:hypothetical protein
MIDVFDYADFRAQFLSLRQSTPQWWRDKTIWQELDYSDTIHRPTEDIALANIAHECRVYTRQEKNATCRTVAVREALSDTRQESILYDRLIRRNLSLKERLAARGMTLMWMHLDTKKRHVEEVYILA